MQMLEINKKKSDNRLFLQKKIPFQQPNKSFSERH